MDFYYEQEYLSDYIGAHEPLVYPAHFQNTIELVYINRGTARAIADGVECSLREGDFFIAFPETVHSYDNCHNMDSTLIIVSAAHFPEYSAIFNSKRPISPLVRNAPPEAKALIGFLTENKDKLPYDYIGFVEGNDISAGRVQVVVTDGFTGNIVLKTVEGTARLVKRVVVENFKKSVLAIIGAFFLIHVFKRLKHKIDPRSYAGATFLGLRGFAVKTHGNSDALAFANSIGYTAELTKANLNGLIAERARALADVRATINAEPEK